MADETKPDPNIDDWDSLPLDPDADDWDDEPAPSLPPNLPDTIDENLATAADDIGRTAPEASLESPTPTDPFADLDPIDDIHLDALSGPSAPTGSGHPPSPDEIEASPQTEDIAPEDFEIAPIDDFEEVPPVEIAPSPLPRPVLDADPLIETPGAPTASTVPDADDDSNQEQDDFNAHLEAMGLNGLDDDGSIRPENSELPDMEAAPSEDTAAVTKKVELDIDGIFLEDAEDEPEPPEEMIEEEPQPEVEPEQEEPAAEEPPSKRKIPRIKLLMVVGLASLGFLGLLFGAYKIFFSGSAEVAPAALVIDPNIPPRDPVPGEFPLEPFYINFPVGSSETIIEMTVILHYEDLPDRAAIERKLTAVRDVIYRVTQGKGAQIVTNGELQRALRQELVEKSNLIFGANKITYVQIGQIRILQ